MPHLLNIASYIDREIPNLIQIVTLEASQSTGEQHCLDASSVTNGEVYQLLL